MQTDAHQSQDRFLSKKELRQRYNIAYSTVYEWINAGILPQPYKLGPKMIRWKLSELEQWEAQNKTGVEKEGSAWLRAETREVAK